MIFINFRFRKNVCTKSKDIFTTEDTKKAQITQRIFYYLLKFIHLCDLCAFFVVLYIILIIYNHP